MKFCNHKECREVACCSFCKHFNESTILSECKCKLYDEMVEHLDLCEEFECFLASDDSNINKNEQMNFMIILNEE